MAYLRVPSIILSLLLISLSSLSFNGDLVGARHLLEIPMPELPEIPKPELPTFPHLPDIPKPELPTFPHLPEFPKPELPSFPHLPDLPKPTLPKDFPVIPTHSTTNP
ncbi:hypothetical protein Patl1_25826 [Pistacia atlantica]|uniref:Uncharacterized protein n=1 Tax=Pistacia atlantica TaxID=434234 RepID=A0ACC1B255_9ROSI|nr:hypothetical protein Patl1_25826 [Pistacia atlantica]